MSLINDALKRAQAAQQEIQPSVTPLPPIEAKPRSETGWLLPLLVILLLAAASFFIGIAYARHASPPIIPEKISNPGK